MRVLKAAGATLMVFLVLGGEAGAATTVGSDLAPAAGIAGGCGSTTCTLVHRSPGVAQAPTDGVVVRWRIKVGSGSPAQPVSLRVVRGVDAGTTGIASGPPEAVPSTPGVYTFAARIPIAAGDFIGIDCCPAGATGTYMSADAGGLTEVWNTRLADGESRDNSGSYGFELLVNADVEPDADRDGYGDETQDLCPTDPTTQGLCPVTTGVDVDPPQTTITKRPKDESAKETAKYKFSSDEDGSTFECKIDKKPFKPCTSPKKFRVKDGKHKFLVRAIDAAGNPDPTAAKDKFKIVD